MPLPKVGLHKAKLCGAIVYSPNGNDGLTACLPCKTEDGCTIMAFQYLFTKDGSGQEKTIAKLQEIFGPSNGDIYWLAGSDHSAAEFEIDVQEEDYQGEKKTKVQWVNPIGGGMFKPEEMEKKSVLAKFSSRFKALSGPAKSPAKPAAKAAPKAPAAPASNIAPSSQDDAWEEFTKANPTLGEEGMANAWFEEIKKMFPGKDQGSLTPKDWGKLKASFDNVQM